jgi:glycosyltransferase involved in cell wall biosynthesis
MHIVHLTASTFYGGPERQMLGLAGHLPTRFTSTFVSFPEDGRCTSFLQEARARGFSAIHLGFDFPKIRDTLRELVYVLRTRAADVLISHTYKPNILGRIAAKRLGIPHIVVSRGWTGETLKVKAYEAADKLNLKFVDRVVCVSEGQARKVRKLKVAPERLSVIPNAARPEAFRRSNPEARPTLAGYFKAPPQKIVLAAGRLSPEKGFGVLIEAMARLHETYPQAGCVIFGEGQEQEKLQSAIQSLGLESYVKLAGFCRTLDSLYEGADVVVLPSYTEGLPNVALEASAAGVPVVATAVGGTPEVVADGETGLLVPSGQPGPLAEAIHTILNDSDLAKRLGSQGRLRMEREYTFESQAKRYMALFESLRPARRLAA